MHDIRFDVQLDNYFLKALDFNVSSDLKVSDEKFIEIDYGDIDFKSYFKAIDNSQSEVIFVLDISSSEIEYKAEYLAKFNLLKEMSNNELKKMLSSIVFLVMYRHSRTLAENILSEALQSKVILPIFDYNKFKENKKDQEN